MKFLLVCLCLVTSCLQAAVELGDVWHRSDGEGASSLRSVVHTGLRYVGVGSTGLLATSTDGREWSIREAPASASLNSVVWSGSLAVAVGDEGCCLVSPDGQTWERRTTGVSANLNHVVWTGTRFVAVGAAGTIVTSPNGFTWTSESSGTAADLASVCATGEQLDVFYTGQDSRRSTAQGSWVAVPFPVSVNSPLCASRPGRLVIRDSFSAYRYQDPGGAWQIADALLYESEKVLSLATDGTAFVAVGENGFVAHSPDGSTWNQINVTMSDDLVSVIRKDSAWEAISARREVLRSADGISWTCQRLEDVNDVVWDGTKHVAVGKNGKVATSPDGRNWTSQPGATTKELMGLAWNGSMFVAAGRDGCIVRSSDGVHWTAFQSGDWDFLDVIWHAGRFLVVGEEGVILASEDGTDWYLSDPGGLDAAVWDGTRFLGFRNNNVLVSSDGNRWRHLVSIEWPFGSTMPDYEIRKMIFTGSRYVAVGDEGWVISSPDGLTWTSGKPEGMYFNQAQWADVAYSGSSFVAVGSEGVARSADGVTWVATTTDPGFRAVVWSGTRWVACSGAVLAYSAAGETWTKTSLAGFTTYFEGGLAAGNGIVLAFGTKNNALAIMKSVDGINWVQVPTAGLDRILSATWTGSGFVATLANGNFATSPNGETWTQHPGPADRVYDAGLWTGAKMFVWSVSGMAATSPDGTTWTHGNRRAGPVLYGWRSVASSGARCVVTAGNRVAVNEGGGDDWAGAAITGLNSICFRGDRFYAIGGSHVQESPDGVNWTDPAAGHPPQGTGNGRIGVAPSGHLLASVTDVWRLDDSGGWVQGPVQTADCGFSSGGGVTLGFGSTYLIVSEDDGRTWDRLDGPAAPDVRFNAVTGFGGGFVAVGNGGSILRSSDGGEHWFQGASSPTKSDLTSIATNGVRVVTAAGPNVYSTTDGAVWNTQTLNPTGMNAVVWTGSEFLFLGNSLSYSSPDALTWSPEPALNGLNSFQTGGAKIAGSKGMTPYYGTSKADLKTVVPHPFADIAFSGSRYVAATGNPVHATDLEAWSAPITTISADAVVWTGDRFVAVGSSGNGGYSADGITWTKVTSAKGSAVVWTGSKLFSFDSVGKVWTSPDGLAWSAAPGSASAALRGAAWSGSIGVAVGASGSVLRTADGVAWAPVNAGLSGTFNDVAWIGDGFVAVGDGGRAARSPDGLVWTMISAGTVRDLKSVAWNGSLATIVSSFGEVLTSPDGLQWTKRFSDISFRLGGVAWTGDRFLAVGRLAAILSSVDGITWERISRGLGDFANSANSGYDEPFLVKAWSGSEFLAINNQGTVLSSPDGRLWAQKRTSFASTALRDAKWVGDRFLLVADGGKIFSSTDGSEWKTCVSGTKQNLKGLAIHEGTAIAVGQGIVIRSRDGLALPWGYESWASDLGTGLESRDDDPDGDGIANLLAYGMGLPAGPATTGDHLRFPKLDPFSGELEFILPDSERADVSYELQRSTDLKTWTSIGTRVKGKWTPVGAHVFLETAVSGGRKVRMLLPTSPIGSGFFTLRVLEVTP